MPIKAGLASSTKASWDFCSELSTYAPVATCPSPSLPTESATPSTSSSSSLENIPACRSMTILAPPLRRPRKTSSHIAIWLVLRRYPHLCKRDEMSRRIFHSNFLRAVKRRSKRHHHRHAFQRSNHRIQIVNLHVKQRRPLAHVLGQLRVVFLHARESLIHHFRRAFLQHHEHQLVAVGNFRRLRASQPVHPEIQARFDFFHQQHRRHFFHLDRLHGLLSLCRNGARKQQQSHHRQN